MKKNYFILSFLLVSMIVSKAFAQDDKQQIRAVIEKETDSFFNVDRKNWESTWLDAAYTHWSLSDSAGGSFLNGTESIRRNFDEYFKTAKPSKSKIERKWIEVRLYNSGAYVLFKQIVADDIDRDETSEMRVLEKNKDGKWKIVCMGSTAK